MSRTWTLLGHNGIPFESDRRGSLGGHRKSKIYGRLDCPAAARAIARGGYVHSRVFFVDAAAAVANGYRPCAVCMPDAYALWKTPPTEPASLD
jgi:hypothetical protein